jgi:hypothetical protein
LYRMARFVTMRPKRKTMSHPETKSATVAVRLENALRERLAALATLMGERAGGPPLPESYAVRAALMRGCDILEAELRHR